MLEDATQYQTLQDTKNKEDMAFQRTQVENAEIHAKAVNKLQ